MSSDFIPSGRQAKRGKQEMARLYVDIHTECDHLGRTHSTLFNAKIDIIIYFFNIH